MASDLRQRSSIPNANCRNNSGDVLCGNPSRSRMPSAKFKKCRPFIRFFQVLFLGLLLIYIILPFLIHFSPALQRNLIFLSTVRWPLFMDLNRPDELGLSGTRNFYISSAENVHLGVWQILPADNAPLAFDADASLYENALKSGNPIVLYVHGNSGTRGGTHRIELYHILKNLNFHVIAFDYRGYADSSNVPPSENGVVEDSTVMYQWLRQKAGNAPLFVWGHSLGAGVATKMVKELCIKGNPPDGLILEAPFNNLRDEVKHYPLAKPYKFFPYFDVLFLDSLERSNIIFASDKSIADITIPIMILHAEDDSIIPFELGRKLYETALKKRSAESGPVKFIHYKAENGYGHRYICRDPNLPNVIREFTEECIAFIQRSHEGQ